jgi:branched-chain amino acid aminotransferase
MFGDMVFEMARSFGGQPFWVRHHLERLYAGLRILEIDCGLTLDEMEAATMQTIEINRPCFPDGLDYQLMHNVSRGPLALYETAFPGGVQPTVTISCWPLTWHLAGVADFYDTGIQAVITPQQSVPTRYIDPKIKNRSRVYYQLANMQAHQVDPKAWALLTGEDGFITEGTGSNFFVVKEGRLLTPRPHNILRGVTRQAVIELAADLEVPCQECDLDPYDVFAADEAFFTATSYSIMPVTRFNGRLIKDGLPGAVTQRLIAAWSEMVGLDIIAQAKEYARVAREM